ASSYVSAVYLGDKMGRYFSSPSAQFCALALTIGLICFSGGVRCEEDGDRLFRTSCGICHTIQPGQNRVGPSLAGVVGRKAGTAPPFNYSDANKKLERSLGRGSVRSISE